MTRCHSEPHRPDQGLAWKEPDPIDFRIETPRLVVRLCELEEAKEVFDVINSCRDALLPWMPWAKTEHHELSSTTEYIAKQLNRSRKPLTPDGVGLAIFDKATGDFVGGTGFHDLRRDTASVEIGYWVRADRQRQGICTEAVAHWISRLLTPQDSGGVGLRRVRIYCSAENVASSRVPQKLGLRQEVHQRQDYFVPDHGVTDRLGWGVMADEWDTREHRAQQSSA